MVRRILPLRGVALTILALLIVSPCLYAADVPWDGGAGTTTWTTGTNWANIGEGENVPESQFGERAVIGSDDVSPAAALNGVAAITANVPNVGGIALGYRERSSGAFVNPAPAAGTLMGSLTISGGTVNSRTTSLAALGADGRVLVGVDGRGYLTMTGGTLNATRLVVAGENITTGNGRSRLELSGSATINVSNAHNAAGSTTNNAAENIAVLGRDLKITGPSVVFNTFGRLTLESTNSYTAVITSPTTHSVLRTTDNLAVVSGSLNVQFSGAGSSGHAFGETWDLVDAPIGIAGNFSNLGPNSDVAVTGLTTPNPIGTQYRVVKTSDGSGQTLQLVYDRLLVLRVNRDTGELTIRNPHGGSIQIDGYTVGSSLGSLLTSYSGISGQAVPPDAGWIKPTDASSQPLNSANALTEVKPPIFSPPSNPTFNVTSIPSFTIGTGFSKTAVGGNVANFGTDGEDLVFTYSTPGGVLTGAVEYVGTKFENDMVLRVNPTTGQAFLKNDSLETLSFDGYTITSATGSLTGGAPWTGITTTGWQKSPATASALSQTNPTSSSTLAPGAQIAIGDIGAFTTTAAQDGLGFKFILSEGLEGAGTLAGDFDTDGDVDGRDFLVWQRNTTVGLLADWQANYGQSGGGASPPETTFRIGTVVFDNTAGVAAISAIPEPSTAVLLAGVMCGMAFARRSRMGSTHNGHISEMTRNVQQQGAAAMSRRVIWCAAVLAVMCGWLGSADRAVAVTQGFTLVNGNFELPGPAGTKVVAFGETGTPFAPSPVTAPSALSSGQLAGSIPGWTFTGGDGGVGEACPGLGCETFGDGLPGDSGTEGKGTGNPGNELLLSTVDGKVYQTSSVNFPAAHFPATQKLLLSFEAHNIYTPVGLGQLTARLYYVDGGGVRQTIGSPVVAGSVETPLAGFTTYSLEIVGGSASLTPALGRPIGVEFDTTSQELDPTALQSWAGVDDVLIEIAGTLPGDFNGDGSINLTDYGIIRDNLETAKDYLFEGDIVRDGFVDLNDFRAWKNLPSVISSGVLAQIAAIPEPSTLVLVLGSAALFGGMRRKRMPRALISCFALVSAMGLASSAQAALLYYDPILTGSNPAVGEYTLGTLGGQTGTPPAQNPTVGSFFTGPWEIQAADAALGGTNVQAAGLSFLGAPAAGGSLISSGGGGASRAFRNLTTPFSATTVGTYYISFLANYGGVGVDPNSANSNDVAHRMIEFLQEDRTEGGNLRVGYMTYNGNFAGRVPSQAPLAAGPFGQEVILEGGPTFATDNGSTHLIVFKFTLTDVDASDRLDIYLDPTENEEPVIASAFFANRNLTLSAISGPVQFGGGGTNLQFDELRVADTFIDVLPEFPLKGDTNGDDLVDQLDYLAIIQNMNLTGRTTAQGDVTGDGRVDLRDLRLWRDHRTDIPGLGAIGGVTVPEPTSVVLGLLASLGVLGLGRRR